jgi:hypothetical protein
MHLRIPVYDQHPIPPIQPTLIHKFSNNENLVSIGPSFYMRKQAGLVPSPRKVDTVSFYNRQICPSDVEVKNVKKPNV